MKENETLKINPLPSKTWYWLHLNDTTVKWNGNVQPCMVTTEEPEQVSEAGLNMKEMTTGAGAEADTLFSDENLPVLQLTAKAEDGERIIRLDISSEDKENAAGTVYIAAEENAHVTVIEKFTSGKKAQSDLAFRTKLYAGKNSTIRLIQINMMDEGQRLLNAVGSVCDETAKLDVLQMFVGRGAAKVRDLFQQAREKAPCIVFIDEIDTIGKKRDGAGFSGNDEREQTLNQLLAEMDGFDGSKGVVILAATNRPESLDPALLRPGRFDRRIPVELPDLAGREAILRVHAKNVKCSPSVDFNAIARASAGASGAELANMVNEAALLAVKDGRRSVVQKDLEEAIETVIAGYQKKGAVISNKEKLIVSYHEIGHALVAALTKGSAPVHKITIVPRTSGALGYTMQVEEGEQHLMTKDEAYSRIMTLTGGRCAEELIFDSITSGASNDIEQATKLARSMVTRLGMSDTFGMTALETVNNQYLGGDTSLACSAETAAKVDEEVVKLIRKAHDEAKELLKNNMSKLHELAKYLYDHETITGEEFMEILQKSA